MKKNKFLLGAIIGAVAGILFAPKSGKETRKDVVSLAESVGNAIKDTSDVFTKKVQSTFGVVNTQTKTTYRTIKAELLTRLTRLKTTGKTIDKQAYEQVVGEVVEAFKNDLAGSKEAGKKLVAIFRADWERVKTALASETEKKKA